MLMNAESVLSTSLKVAPVAERKMAAPPKPTMYVLILATWLAAVIWFQPRLLQLLDMATDLPGTLALGTFIVFINFAWLYGIYNLGVVGFAVWYRYFGKKDISGATGAITNAATPPVAILYTTCNDFVEASVLSCVKQDYPNYKVYILDDSSQEDFKTQVDQFAAQYPRLVQVVRRPDRRDFKAGNMNHALEHVVTTEKYFAVADADEILPPEFLTKTVAAMESDPTCGFVQANHRSNPESESPLSKSLGVGVDIHWKWYQPLRNDYGFVMFLGHGALLRRDVWAQIGGFPGIVSEDLGFAIHARDLGYRGRFLEDIICYEDFPDSVRAFRIRHMKWTRGTSEFLKKKMNWLIKSKNISWAEKLDILFPTLNLPLTLLYLGFMLNANLFLPYLFGQPQDVTFVVGAQEMTMPIIVLNPDFQVIYGWDFYLITLLTFFSPVLSFIIAMAKTPMKLYRFLSHSTVMYAALTPLSSIGVLAYLVSGKATFIVTGDKQQSDHQTQAAGAGWRDRLRSNWQQLLYKSHPDMKVVQAIEIAFGILFGVAAIFMFQISFMGLCLAFLMMPLMHHVQWENRFLRALTYVPFALILIGVILSGFSVFGMKAVFFGYGFHF